MAAEMSKRQRVERAMDCQQTDRVPLYDILICDAAIEHFSGEKLPPLVRDDRTRAEVDRIAGKAVDRMLDATRHSGFGTLGERDYVDEFGFHIHDDAWEKTSWIVKRPFDDEVGAAEYLKKLIDGLTRQTRKISANPQAHREQFLSWWRPMQKRIGSTVHLLAEQGTGLDDIRHKLGLEIFSYLAADDPGIIDEACEAWTVRNLAHCHAIAEPALSPAVLTYCDIACKGRLIHSPEYLRGHLFPQLKRLNDAWHEHGLKCLFHSDGYLMEVMDDLVAAGIDGLNPIETVAGMDLREVRRKYPKIFLAGGIDMSQLLSRGTPEQVKEVCRQAIRDTCPGYLMGSTTESDNSCKPENLLAMYEVAMEGL